MTPQELKASILQLAIQGKLVEQRPEEGTGAELLEKIVAAKGAGKSLTRRRGERGGGAALTLENISAHSAPQREEILDVPFDIPESWAWVRLGEVITLLSGTDFSPEEYNDQGKGMPYITGASSLSETGVIVNRWTECPKVLAQRGDVLLVCKGSGYGKTVFCDIDNAHIARQIMAVKQTSFLNMAYIRFYLMSNLRFIKSKGQGVIPGIDRGSVLQMPFPLPPLAEQKRIVAKIAELLPLIDRYEQAWGKLEDFNKRFPMDMQKSLLQMAIQGKLVEQRPEEGTGAELLEKILNAKSAKGTKKSLTEPWRRGAPATSAPSAPPREEILDAPFDIPESWVWVRLGDAAESIQYGYNAPAKELGRIRMVRISDIHDDKVEWERVPYCDIREQDIPSYLLTPNDILFARTGGTVGKSYLVSDVPHESIYAGYLIRVRFMSGLLLPSYVKLFMDSPLYWAQLRDGTIATAQPNCNGKTLSKMLIPLPPLAEQKRIVAELEELLPLCERLK